MFEQSLVISSVKHLIQLTQAGLDNYPYDEKKQIQLERIKKHWDKVLRTVDIREKIIIKQLRDDLSATTDKMKNPQEAISIIADSLLLFVNNTKLSKNDLSFCKKSVEVFIKNAVNEDRKSEKDSNLVLEYLGMAVAVVDKTAGGFPEMRMYRAGLDDPRQAGHQLTKVIYHGFSKLNLLREKLAEDACDHISAVDRVGSAYLSTLHDEELIFKKAARGTSALRTLLDTPVFTDHKVLFEPNAP